GESQRRILNLCVGCREQGFEVAALNVERYLGSGLCLIEPRGVSYRRRRARAGDDLATLKERLRQLCVRRVGVGLVEDCADSARSRALNDVRLAAIEPELRQSGRACDRHL